MLPFAPSKFSVPSEVSKSFYLTWSEILISDLYRSLIRSDKRIDIFDGTEEDRRRKRSQAKRNGLRGKKPRTKACKENLRPYVRSKLVVNVPIA